MLNHVKVIIPHKRRTENCPLDLAVWSELGKQEGQKLYWSGFKRKLKRK